MNLTYEEAVKLRSTAKYRRLRRKFMMRHPLCEHCRKNGRTVISEELDHVVPVKLAPELFWDEGNWQALCYSCHLAKSQAENQVRKGRPDPLRDAFEEEIRRSVNEIKGTAGIRGL